MDSMPGKCAVRSIRVKSKCQLATESQFTSFRLYHWTSIALTLALCRLLFYRACQAQLRWPLFQL